MSADLYCCERACALKRRKKCRDVPWCGFCAREKRKERRNTNPEEFCSSSHPDCFLRFKGEDSDICGYCTRKKEEIRSKILNLDLRSAQLLRPCDIIAD